MKYVGRYDNCSGFMEWCGRPVSTVNQAKEQANLVQWTTAVDVVEVRPGMYEGCIVAEKNTEGNWDERIN